MRGAGRIALGTLGFLILSGAASFSQTDSRSYPDPIYCLTCLPKDRTPAPEPPRHTVMTQRLDAFDAWLAHLSGGKPILIQTHRANLIAVLEDGPAGELLPTELAYLRQLFPKLALPVKTLDAHQLAHVLAFRLAALQTDMAGVLELEQSGLVKRVPGSTVPIAASHVDVCVFSKQSAYDAFVDFRFPRGSWPLEGAMFDQVPTSAMLMPSLKEPGASRQFTFTSALQLARKLSRDEPGLQGWLQIGLAHFFEERGPGGRMVDGPTLPPDLEAPKDWEGFVGDLVTSGKVGDLGAMAVTPRKALSVRSRLQAWSMVRWMVGKDPKAFAAMVRLLLHAGPLDTPAKALLEAVRPTLHHDLVTLVTEWREAVKKSRLAAK